MGFVAWMNSLPPGAGGIIGIAVGVVLVVTLQIAIPALLDWRERRRFAKWCPCGRKDGTHESWCLWRVKLK